MIKLHQLLICGWMMMFPGWLAAQPRWVPGEILVSLKPGIAPNQLIEHPDQQILWNGKEKITEIGNIWRIHFDQSAVDQDSLLHFFRHQPGVRFAQFNHYVAERKNEPNALPYLSRQSLSWSNVAYPDDPNFSAQWYLDNNGQNGGLPGADIGAVPAWNITTGGIAPTGDTVVVAVIDGGICPYCEEFNGNLWINHQEIPGDGIDNDGNGYFDDYRGWNVNAQNDDILGFTSNHGTAVSGIIGAKGNNGIGISGVMWDTKIMFVAGTSGTQTTESQILAAYEYVWKARKTYNETNGAKGAFVVAVNCSFGINFSTPLQSPLWCDMLDQLGEQGILTVGASANGNWNVDEVGDIPTTCPSDYLIAVTSLDFEDQKSPSASWGPESVDLGAYGSGILSLSTGTSSYGVVSGTSFAAPQVSGAIGLLYTAPCANLASLSQENPSVAAITAKNILLSNTKAVSSLQNITTSNGKLSLSTMLDNYTQQCESCPRPYSVTATVQDTANAIISWVTTPDVASVHLMWRQSGSITWNEITGAIPPYFVQNLEPCTQYEYALKSVCDSIQSAWSPIQHFTTDGCCLAPEGIIAVPHINSAIVHWTPVSVAPYYNLRYKIQPSNTWTLITHIVADSLVIENLEPCSTVEIQVQTICPAGPTDFSPVVTFQTSGCGACYDKTYCASQSNHAAEEWISKVEIGPDWSFESLGYQGYQDLTGQPGANLLQLYPEQTLTATVYPDFIGATYFEMFRIYVDFNLDGDFEDAGELVFDPGFAHNGPLTSNFITPYFTSEGITRMRVQMKFKSSGFLYLPLPCETFEYGQVEDYCAALHTGSLSASIPAPTSSTVKLFPNPVESDFTAIIPGETLFTTALVSIYDQSGQLVKSGQYSSDHQAIRISALDGLTAGVYLVKIIIGEKDVYWGRIVKV